MKNFLINHNKSLRDALRSINKNGNKCVIVCDKNKKFLGTLSDGDIRKAILSKAKLTEKIKNYYNSKAKFLIKNKFNKKDLEILFFKKKFDIIPILDELRNIVEVSTWTSVFNKKKIVKKNNTPVIIMAGGKGERLQPFTNILPKPLIPIKGKPVIEYIMDKFEENGFSNFYLTINHKAQIIKSYFKDHDKYNTLNFYNEKKPLGTAGSINKISLKKNKHFFVSNCDIILDIDYLDLLKFHINNKYDITVVGSAKEFQIPYGVCHLSNNGNLKSIEEKPKYDFLVNAGLYLLNSEIKNLVPKDIYFDFTNLINLAQRKNKKIGVYPVHENQWIDIGQWSEFRKAIEVLQ